MAKLRPATSRPGSKVAANSKGGRARAAALTPERRREIGQQAAAARWAGRDFNKHPRRGRELEWVAQHGREFSGLWVAVEGSDLIASDPKPEPVFAAARAKGITRPFVVHLEPADSLPFGGW